MGIVARVSPGTWDFQEVGPGDPAPPAEARARRWFATVLFCGWVAGALGVALICTEGMRDESTIPLGCACGIMVVVPVALVAAMRHRRVRHETGVPVIGELRDLMEAVSAMLAYHRALSIELAGQDFDDPAERAEARRSADQLARNMRPVRRELIVRCELAARAERKGRFRARDRHVRWLFRHCRPFVQQLLEMQERNQSPEA